MEIKDAISLYTFLGQLGLWGAIAFSIIIIVLIAYLLSATMEKTIDDKGLRRQILLVSVIILMVCMIILIRNSIDNVDDTADATAIKSYMVSMKWKWLGYNRLATEVNLPDLPALRNNPNEKLVQQRIQHIQEVVSRFPDEFEMTTVYDDFSKDSLGIELIDTNAVNVIAKYNEEMLPFFTSKIINHMQTANIDTVSYNYIAAHIDHRLQPYLIDQIAAKADSLFIPININLDDGLIMRHKITPVPKP